MQKAKLRNVNCPEKLDSTQRLVYDYLISGMDKKEVCNKCNVDMSTVIWIYDHFHLGLFIKKTKENAALKEAFNEVKTSNKPKRKTKVILSDEEKKELTEAYINKDLTVAQICEMYNISSAAAYKYIKEFKDLFINSDNNNEVQEETKVEDNQMVLTKIVPNKDLCVCGLVKDRHNMPVDDYIFENIDNELMFDFNKLESIAANFIYERCFEDDKPVKNLVLYVTGLQSALGAVVRAADYLHIKLCLMHYNASNCKYEQQKIFGEFEMNRTFIDTFTNNNAAYICNGTKEDIINSEKIYIVNLAKKDNKISYFCTDLNDAWKIYMNSIMKYKNTMAIFLEEYEPYNGAQKLKKVGLIAKNV